MEKTKRIEEIISAHCLVYEGIDVSEIAKEIIQLDEWVSVENETPIGYETGDWDGKKSDEVLCIDATGEKHIATVYEGFMDGAKFVDWYDKDGYVTLNDVTHWQPLPNKPKPERSGDYLEGLAERI